MIICDDHSLLDLNPQFNICNTSYNFITSQIIYMMFIAADVEVSISFCEQFEINF